MQQPRLKNISSQKSRLRSDNREGVFMRLTGNILLQYLSEKFPVRETGRPEESRELKGALLCHASPDLREIRPEEWIYVAETDTAGLSAVYEEDLAKAGLLILTVSPGKQGLPVNAPYIVLEADSPGTVLNEVNKIFADLRSWEERLLDIQYRMGSAREMLEASVAIFENPLFVLDDTFSVLTSVSPENSSSWQDVFAPGREKMDLLRSIARDPRFIESRNRKDVYPGPDAIIGFRTFHWNVFRGGKTRYSLVVAEEGRRLTPSDADLLELLGTHVKFALFHQERTDEERSSKIEPVLTRILEDRMLDYQEGSHMLENLGWKSEHSYLALVYQLTYLDQEVLPVLSICRYMQEQFPSCCSFPFEGDIVSFFNLSLSVLSEEEIQMQLKPFIRDSYLKAGFSRTMAGHMDLRRQYVQAKTALDVGSRKYPYQWINYFDQIAFTYIMEQAVRRLPARMLAHEGVLRLQDSDRKHGTEYVKTLQCYLDHHQNAVQTAKELFIHRSTFLYRLEKIRELLESSLEDPEEVLYLMISLSLLDQKG